MRDSFDDIIKKLERLSELIEENYSDSDEFIIAPDRITVMRLITEMKRRKELPGDKTLKHMNGLWKKHRSIKKHGGPEKFEQVLQDEIDEKIRLGHKIQGIKLIRDKSVVIDGTEMHLAEAKEEYERRQMMIEYENQ